MATESDSHGAIEHVLALKALHDFAAVHPDDLAVLALRATPRRIEAGDPLPAGGEGGSVHFLLEGRLRGGEAAALHEAPAMLGLVDVLAGGRTPALVAEVACSTLEIDRRALLAVLEDEFELWLAVFRCVARSAVASGCRFGTDGREAPDRAPQLADLAERIAMLKRLTPFDGMPIHLLGLIAAELKPFAAEPGCVLWNADEAATRAILVVDGLAASDGDADAGVCGAGSILGIADALAGDRHVHRIVARSAVRGLSLETETLIDLLEDDPAAAVELLCAIAHRAFERRTETDVANVEA